MTLMDKWRSTLIKLVILELVLCAVFFVAGHISGNAYFRGVGVGLLIAWVTGTLAYFIVKSRADTIQKR
jgi:hypothetical protein